MRGSATMPSGLWPRGITRPAGRVAGGGDLDGSAAGARSEPEPPQPAAPAHRRPEAATAAGCVREDMPMYSTLPSFRVPYGWARDVLGAPRRP